MCRLPEAGRNRDRFVRKMRMQRKRPTFLTLSWQSAIVLLFLVIALSAPVLAQNLSFTIAAGVENEAYGSIKPSGNVVVAQSGNQTFVVTTKTGYRVGFLLVDGRNQGPLSSFTFTDVSANHTISAVLAPMAYNIDAHSGPNGSLSPNSMQVVEHGQSQTFTITPNDGYEIEDVLVDGSSHGAVSTYTFTDVQQDHTFAVTFAPVGSVAGAGTSPSQPISSITPVSPRSDSSSVPSQIGWPILVAIIAGLIAMGAAGGVLFLRIRERKAGPRAAQALFTVKDLEISPRELRPGTKATVAVTVSNNGHHAGTFKVTLKIDGVTLGAKDITLARNMSDRVEFSIPATSPGAFAVNVANLSGTLTVLDA